jgi:hypothetical protein
MSQLNPNQSLEDKQIIFLAQPSHRDFGQVETFTTVAAPAEFQ